ncbi:hypothetical protein G9A89_021092 [Geosiphon pyriformis]|nr:hypothetical protein G9A89_021092 [Geosiphon pyriformis]
MTSPDFYNKCWIEKKHICCIIAKKDLLVSWNKVKGNSGVVKNECADFYADIAVTSKFFLPIVIPYCFLVVEGRPVSGNAHYVAKKLFNVIHSVGWETRCISSIISAGLSDCFNKARTFLFGILMTESDLVTLALRCTSVNGNAVTDLLNEAVSSIDLFTVLVKSFVLKSWVVDTLGYLGANSDGGVLVVNFVHYFANSHRSAVWLPAAKLRAFTKNIIFCHSAGTVWDFGFRLSIHMCFGLHLCLTKSDFGFLCKVSMVGNLSV